MRAKKQTKAPPEFSTASLFAGCGGLDLGFRGDFESLGKRYAKLPFNLVWANDYSERACETYAANIGGHIHQGDIREILKNPEAHAFPESVDVLLGGFPCQAFSLAGKRLGFEDPRGQLYLAMAEAVAKLRPKMFVGENVKGLLTHDDGKTFQKILEDFRALGYAVTWSLRKAVECGVPQTRERVIVTGTRIGVLPEFAHSPAVPMPMVTSRDALKGLENVGWGEAPNHEWSKARKNKGQGNTTLNPNLPAPTMRAEHHGNIEYHYSLGRRLSAREAARIQTFPDSFVFKRSATDAYRQIGNAVPPVLGWHVASEVAAFLIANSGKAVSI